jgi:hypothetical protein
MAIRFCDRIIEYSKVRRQKGRELPFAAGLIAKTDKVACRTDKVNKI